MNNFVARALTGVVFVIVLLGSIIWSPISFALLFTVITVLSIWEFLTLSAVAGASPQKWWIVITSGGLFILANRIAAGDIGFEWSVLVLPVIYSVFIIELYKKSESPFTNIAFNLLGVLYVLLPFALLNFLAYFPFSARTYTPHILLGCLFLQWSSDTGAYIAGRTMGKHKLFERISPKKTWEGSIGGTIITLGVAYVISLFYTELSLTDWSIIALIIVVAGNFGDLAESMFKRSINIKDSGTILPGHGGLLDRFDGLVISVPFVVAYLAIR